MTHLDLNDTEDNADWMTVLDKDRKKKSPLALFAEQINAQGVLVHHP
jgi:hypothetical protein